MAHPRKLGLLAKLKMLCTKDDEQAQADYDAVLDFTIDKVTDDVANYTHIAIAELPVELDTTIVAMAVNAVTELGLLAAVGSDGMPVTSLSEGDTSTSFVSPLDAYKALTAGTTLTTNYMAALNSYRVAKW